ncbi:Polyadenylate-binding 1-A [Gossypium australe]|uniref:Polyadenylate-binding 1-A n=1 Tax=Gossypium australe TaxID=47621 RepID=A0A5B6WHH7_9ROSI|nr:Polyadenylate-binding 1-A [Gossypium australe]
MLECPLFQKSNARETSDSKFDPEASEAPVTENSSHSAKSFESVSVPKSPEIITRSPGGTEGVSSGSTSDTIGGNAFEGPVVNATSELHKIHYNPYKVGLSDIQSKIQPSEPVIVSRGNEKDELRTLATDVVVENSLKLNQPKRLSDIFVKMLENDVEGFQGAKSDVLGPTSEKPVRFLDGTNDLSEIMNYLPGNRTATSVQRPSATTISGKKHASSKSSSRIEDLVKVINREKNDPTAGEMAGILRDTLAPTESSKWNKIEKEKNSDLSEIMNYLSGNRTATSVQRPSATTISGKKHASSKSSSRIEDLMKVINREKNDPTTGEMAGILHDTLAPTESLKGNKIEKEKNSDSIEDMKEVLGEKLTKSRERAISNVTDQTNNGGFLKNVYGLANLQNSDVKGRHTSLKLLLMQLGEPTIKGRGSTILDVTDQRSNGGFLKNVQSPTNLQSSDVERSHTLLESTIKDWERTISNVTDQLSKNVRSAANLQNFVKRRHTLLKHHMSSGNISLDIKKESSIPTESISDKEDSNLDLANSGHVKSGPNSHVSLPVSREELNHSQTCFLTKEGYKDNKVLVRFLTKNVKKLNILAAFSDCGPIVKVEELSSTKESSFKDFLVNFKTREGSQLALKKNDLMVMETEAFVEPTSSEDTAGAIISIPDPISDPKAPTALLKNPTKTVKVKNLCEDISLQQLKEALAFHRSSISNIFLGSTTSVVYVEFETEDAKERALAQQSVLVSGKELLILRIDAPMTTVVRISNINPTSKVWTICNSYGQVKYLAKRGVGVVDVHFKLAEWPNMLNIVNNLNGIEVDENRWLAQPAPIFPVEILRALWSRPEERRHVNCVIYRLLRELEEPISATELSRLTNLATRYYYGKEI